MKRRQVLAALGAVSGSSALLTGTGAFTSVSADRAVSVSVADDSDAFLALAPSSGPNGTFATETGGTLALDFSDTGAGGEGLGTDSVYEFDDVFRVENQGTQPVYVWSTFSGAGGDFDANGSDTDIWLYPNGDSQDKLRDSDDDVLYLSIGQSAEIGAYVNTTDVTSDQDLTMTIHADADSPAGSGAVGGGGTAIAGPTNGLVGYWPLDTIGDGTAEDVVGTNNGSPNGVSSAAGQVGSAASFDGSDDYVTVPDDSLLDLTDRLTLAAWVKPASGQESYARIVSREQSGVGNRQYNLGIGPNAETLRTVVDTTASDTVEVSSSETVANDNWHHAAVTFDELDAVRLYVDGNPVDTTAVNGPLVSRNSSVNFGAPAHLPDKDRFDGRIDDVRVYNRALSDSEIQTLYDETK